MDLSAAVRCDPAAESSVFTTLYFFFLNDALAEREVTTELSEAGRHLM